MNILQGNEAEYLGVKMDITNIQQDEEKVTTMRPYEFMHELEEGLRQLEKVQNLDRTEEVSSVRFNRFADENYVNEVNDKISDTGIRQMSDMEYWVRKQEDKADTAQQVEQTFNMNTGEIYSNPLNSLIQQKQYETSFSVMPAFNHQQAETAEYLKRQYMEDQFNKQNQINQVIESKGGLSNPETDADIEKYLLQRHSDQAQYISQADQLARELQRTQMELDRQQAEYSVSDMRNQMVNSAMNGDAISPYNVHYSNNEAMQLAWARIRKDYKDARNLPENCPPETILAYCNQNNINIDALLAGMMGND